MCTSTGLISENFTKGMKRILSGSLWCSCRVALEQGVWIYWKMTRLVACARFSEACQPFQVSLDRYSLQYVVLYVFVMQDLFA